MHLKPEYMLKMFLKDFFQRLESFITIVLFQAHQVVSYIRDLTKFPSDNLTLFEDPSSSFGMKNCNAYNDFPLRNSSLSCAFENL